MLFSLIGVVALANLVGGSVLAFDEERECGTQAPTPGQLKEMSRLMEEEDQMFEFQRGPVSIFTVFHVVALNETVAGGMVTGDQLAKQIDVLNEIYNPHNFDFKWVNTSRTVNESWAKNEYPWEMNEALHEGTYSTLNIYVQADLGIFLGYAHLPKHTVPKPGSDAWNQDGLSIDHKTLPGGRNKYSNQGKTAVHEVGHWLNLLHTFQGACKDGKGDHINDTPASKGPSNGCPIGRDSCPGKKGKDPIHNYMDYSRDSCKTEFTPGQVKRMHNSWRKYRKGK